MAEENKADNSELSPPVPARTGWGDVESSEQLARSLGSNLQEGLATVGLANDPDFESSPPPLLRHSFFFTLIDWIPLTMWLAVIISFIALEVTTAESHLSVGITLVILIILDGAYVYMCNREPSLGDAGFRMFLPPTARVIRGGRTVMLEANSVEVGDIIILNAGDKVLFDICLWQCQGLVVDRAWLGGDGSLLPRSTRRSHATDLTRSQNIALAGDLVCNGSGKGIVLATGRHTVGAGLRAQAASLAAHPYVPAVTRFLRTLSLATAVAAVALSALVALVASLTGGGVDVVLACVVGVLLACVPPALPFATLSLLVGCCRQLFSARLVLTRGLNAFRTVGETTALVASVEAALLEPRLEARALLLPGVAAPLCARSSVAPTAPLLLQQEPQQQQPTQQGEEEEGPAAGGAAEAAGGDDGEKTNEGGSGGDNGASSGNEAAGGDEAASAGEEGEGEQQGGGSENADHSDGIRRLLLCAALCNTAQLHPREVSGDDEATGEAACGPVRTAEAVGSGGLELQRTLTVDVLGDARDAALLLFAQEQTGGGIIPQAEQHTHVAELPPSQLCDVPRLRVTVHRSPATLPEAASAGDATADKKKKNEKVEAGSDNASTSVASAFVVRMCGDPLTVLSRCDSVLAPADPSTNADADADATAAPWEGVAMTEQLREQLKTQLSALPPRSLALAELTLPSEQFPATFSFDTTPPNFPVGLAATAAQSNATEEGAEEAGGGVDTTAAAASAAAAGKLTLLGAVAVDPAIIPASLPLQLHRDANMTVALTTSGSASDLARIVQDAGLTALVSDGTNAAVPAAAVVADVSAPEFADNVAPWLPLLQPQSGSGAGGVLLFSGAGASHRATLVRALQAQGQVVAAVGAANGDLPTLAAAQLAVCGGMLASNEVKDGSDFIILDDCMGRLCGAIADGRSAVHLLYGTAALALCSCLPQLLPFLLLALWQMPLPLSVGLIITLDHLVTPLLASALPADCSAADAGDAAARDTTAAALLSSGGAAAGKYGAAPMRGVLCRLASLAYLQIGLLQALALLLTYSAVLSSLGYPLSVLPGLGSFNNWGHQPLFCQLSGGLLYNEAGHSMPLPGSYDGPDGVAAAFAQGFMFWDSDTTGSQGRCEFAPRDFTGGLVSDPKWAAPASGHVAAGEDVAFTAQQALVSSTAIKLMHLSGYVEYMPHASRTAAFFSPAWLALDPTQPGSGVAGTGPHVTAAAYFRSQSWNLWSLDPTSAEPDVTAVGTAAALATINVCKTSASIPAACTSGGADVVVTNQMYHTATPVLPPSITNITADGLAARLYSWGTGAGGVRINAANRQMQSEALLQAQAAAFICIAVTQVGALLAVRARSRPLLLGRANLPSAAFLAYVASAGVLLLLLCYVPGLNAAMGLRPVQFAHWWLALPFAALIVALQELKLARQRGHLLPQYGRRGTAADASDGVHHALLP